MFSLIDVTDKRSHRNADYKNVTSNKNDITPLQKCDEVDTNLVLPNNENITTYTDINKKNKEENNTETTSYINPEIIREQLGHKDLRTTYSYIYNNLEDNEIVSGLEKALK